MKKVRRDEIVDFQTYAETRDAFRARVLDEKARRRVHVGSAFTFLFENSLTVRYQIQEMMRAERIVRERDIQHEIDTYNELLGGDGELGATLLVEVEDPDERDRKLREWLDLPDRVAARLADGTWVPGLFDRRQVGGDRLSSVQYVRFEVRREAPVAIRVDLPEGGETPLSDEQRAAIAADL